MPRQHNILLNAMGQPGVRYLLEVFTCGAWGVDMYADDVRYRDDALPMFERIMTMNLIDVVSKSAREEPNGNLATRGVMTRIMKDRVRLLPDTRRKSFYTVACCSATGQENELTN